jgi:hypothetical protein
LKRFLQLLQFACAVGLLATFIDFGDAVAAGTCSSEAKPDFMSGSPPQGERSPIAIRTDPEDSTHCTLQNNQCVAPTPHPTVVETAPTCKCVCR